VITRNLRDFVGRDWRAARAAKDDYWARRIARLGACEGLRIGDQLRQQARRQVPGWPSPADREQDLADHIALATRLRHVGRTRGC
jgi:hypothetical protein